MRSRFGLDNRDFGYAVGLVLTPRFKTAGQGVVAEREHAGGKQRGVDRAGPANGQGADRTPGGICTIE